MRHRPPPAVSESPSPTAAAALLPASRAIGPRCIVGSWSARVSAKETRRKRSLRLALLGSLMLVGSQAFAQGIDLSWDACIGHAAAKDRRTFSCSGTVQEEYSLMLQFKTAQDIPNFVAAVAYVDLQLADHQPLSPFWRFENGGCNRSGFAVHDALPASCDEVCVLDPWGGDGSEGDEQFAAYGVDFRRPGNGYFVLADVRTMPIRLHATKNYFAMEMRFDTRNRATCAGCDEGGVLAFQKLELESNDGSPRVDLTSYDKYGQCAGLNGDFHLCYCGCCNCPSLRANAEAGNPCNPTPTHPSTWRMLKTLYR
jgi:hypothetical protein